MQTPLPHLPVMIMIQTPILIHQHPCILRRLNHPQTKQFDQISHPQLLKGAQQSSIGQTWSFPIDSKMLSPADLCPHGIVVSPT
jgi:hypothetical protein